MLPRRQLAAAGRHARARAHGSASCRPRRRPEARVCVSARGRRATPPVPRVVYPDTVIAPLRAVNKYENSTSDTSPCSRRTPESTPPCSRTPQAEDPRTTRTCAREADPIRNPAYRRWASTGGTWLSNAGDVAFMTSHLPLERICEVWDERSPRGGGGARSDLPRRAI